MPVRPAIREGWILAGTLEGHATSPALLDDVCGMSHVVRLACDLSLAGVRRVVVVWLGERPVPDLAAARRDPRLAARATLELVTAPPPGDDRDGIVVVRADRIGHRDVAKLAAEAWRGSTATLGKVRGAEYDGIVACDRAAARAFAGDAARPGGLAIASSVTAAEPPYAGFMMAVPDRRALARAERRLVGSLRKAADGVAAKAINRRVSLPITYLLRRTPIHPNHITVIALACAVLGGWVLAHPGHGAGLAGMLLVELGSIIDGIDGELARLRYQFSRTGQWLDTVADDLANVAYATGIMLHLDAAGSAWAMPVGMLALTAFALTQIAQYLLITLVYRSGDLAAIPWAFQSATFLSQRPRGLVARLRATAPKLLKRDFVVTLFVVLAALGRLDAILVAFSTGALVFFVVLAVQAYRNRASFSSP